MAVDPADDRAVATWLAPAAGGLIQYTVSRGAVGYRPRGLPAGAAAAAAGGVDWLRITGGAALAALLLALASVALRRRARARCAGS